MTKEKLKQIVNQRIEEMLKSTKGALLICSFSNCKKIGILIKKRKYWMAKSENPEVYDNLVSHYNQLGKDILTNGISHGYCPEDYKRILRESDFEE